jgi:hypothetical protein
MEAGPKQHRSVTTSGTAKTTLSHPITNLTETAMTRNLIACTLIASATFVAVAADLHPAFIVEAPERRATPIPTTPSSLEARIVPIEDLKGPDPASCALEVCESNVEPRAAR